MGYRSDVYIKALKKHTTTIIKSIKHSDLLQYAEINQDDTYLYVQMSDMKWYSQYDDVALVNSTISNLPSDQAALIAIGEDSAISESINDSWELELDTYIVIEGMDIPEDSDKIVSKDELVNELIKSNPEYFI